ncbi:xanthine dehydrogenase molybdopterin binding subunit [Aquipuribacter nitratireducens]|uniref:Xanthine dehydrogenase molybdopterin binding subunit n=1 Tax=Aquipuribacter nitratireducens TaxID=650104 RepID=A0ABW0GSV8_9MICO
MTGPARAHESAVAHVTGRAVYTDDQHPPTGQLSARPVLSPHAHARIVAVDTTEALAVPGVVVVLGPEHVPGVNDCTGHAADEELLPTDEVHHVGHAVRWVVAETDEAARRGAAAVRVGYEPLPAVLDVDEAVATGSVHAPPARIERGTPDDVLDAPGPGVHVLAGEVRTGAQDHFYLETHAAWAHVDAEGHVACTVSTQHPSETQLVVAKVLGVPRSQVVVTCLRMGGGFGGKESQCHPFAALAALAALVTGRPVRVRLDRGTDMVMTGKRHPFLARYRVACDDDGRLLALDARLVSDGGWSMDLSLPVTSRAMFHVDNAYAVPHLRVTGQVARTNHVSHTAFRGFGGPQGMLVAEEVVDRVARHLGLLPEVVRERNLYRGPEDGGDIERSTTHYGQRVLHNRQPRIWSELSTRAGLAGRRAEVARANSGGGASRRGLAITPVKFGISFTKSQYNQAGALVLVYVDGSVQLNHGGTEMGQGLHAKMLHVAATTLGVRPERIRAMPTATDKVPNTSATAASSGADLNGQAVLAACSTVRDRLAVVAARLLGRDAPEDLVFADEHVFPANDPGHRVVFDDVVAAAYDERVSLSATGYYRTPNLTWDPGAGRGTPFHYFAFGAALTEVEVDGFTGTYRVRAVDVLHDVGDSLNPLVDRGQVEGGFVQGMGWLTTEECVWSPDGRFLTAAPSTYTIPTIAEVPEHFEVHLLADAPQERTVLGSKAVGEPPFMLALSVREALRDAVAAFGPAGPGQQVALAVPATPEAVLAAVDAVRGRAGSAPAAAPDRPFAQQ